MSGLTRELLGEDEIRIPIIHRGIVEAVDDPDKSGRVKVRVFGLHSDDKQKVKTEHLPWAMPAIPITQAGGGLRNMGISAVPNVGSHIFCFFEGGNHHTPIYFAGAPSIEDCTDYGEYKNKGARYPNDEPGDNNPSIHEYDVGNYDYDRAYDDKSNWDQELKEYETGGENDNDNGQDIKNEHAVPDLHCSMRQNIECEGVKDNPPEKPVHMYSGNNPSKKNPAWAKPYPYYPEEFFITEIETAFKGRAYYDSPHYNGNHDTMISDVVLPEHIIMELDKWDERKWGWNDNKTEDFGGERDQWKPKYPMLSAEMSSFGFMEIRDNLKERVTFVHPSKYYHELVQLDSTRERLDFYNELSAKKIYERQRNVKSFDREPCDRLNVDWDSTTNALFEEERGKKRNKIVYDDNEGETREQVLMRFEERKHVPGRVKRVVEDHIYEHYMNKINFTITHDRSVKIREGNDNLEIAVGDRNTRIHIGSENVHLDKGTFNYSTSYGWHHVHLKQGHQYVEIGTQRTPAPNVGFKKSTSVKHDDIFFPGHDGANGALGVQGPGYEKKSNGKEEADLAEGSQYYLLHDGNQHFQLYNGNIIRTAGSNKGEVGRANYWLALTGTANENANVKEQLISTSGSNSANHTILLKGSGEANSANYTLSCVANGGGNSGNMVCNMQGELVFNVDKDHNVKVKQNRKVVINGISDTWQKALRIEKSALHVIIGPVIIVGDLVTTGSVTSPFHHTIPLPVH